MTGGAKARAGVALVAGVGRCLHRDRVGSLRYAPSDARAVARLLVSEEIGGFPKGQVRLLLNEKADREHMVRSLSKWLPEHSRGMEIALIYFAGHGMVRRLGAKEEGFLLTHDADPDDVVTTGVSMSQIAEWMGAIEARSVVVILDCCHAGKVLPRGATTRSVNRDLHLPPSVLDPLEGNGRFLIASCDHGQKSIEAPERKHGLFTYHLLRGLRGEADLDHDDKVGVDELFRFLMEEVPRDARENFGLSQDPRARADWSSSPYLSWARNDISGETQSSVENSRETLGPTTAADFERLVPGGEVAEIRSALRVVRRRRDPEFLPFLLHCLGHASEPVRDRAHALVRAIGWDKVSRLADDLARRCDESGVDRRLGLVLDGLDAIAAHQDVIALLQRMLLYLTGPARLSAALLLEKKQLARQLDQLSILFRERLIPYHFKKVLGQGIFTSTYLAQHDHLGKDYVVRVLRPEFVDRPEIRKQFRDVILRAEAYHHEGLVRVRDMRVEEEGRIVFVVRDYVPGVALSDVIRGGKRFEPIQTLEILRQVVDALGTVHKLGQAHGGIKPSNLFLSEGVKVSVVLGDPGLPLSLVPDYDRLSYEYRYVPPELFRGEPVLPQGDFYALGCVAYELLSGSPPYTADHPIPLGVKHLQDPIPILSDQNPVLGTLGDLFLRRLLAKIPGDRFADTAELAGNLRVLRAFVLSAAGQHVTDTGVGRPVTIIGASALAEYAVGNSIVGFPNATGAPDVEGAFDTRELPVPRPGTPAEPISGVSIPPPEGKPPAEGQAELVPAAAHLRTNVAEHSNSVEPDLGFRSSADRYELAPGQLFGRFVIKRRIGKGGMGSVWEAYHSELDQRVALKIPHWRDSDDARLTERFRREGRVLARLSHPNICLVYDAGIIDGIPFISMPFIEGRSLAGFIERGCGMEVLSALRIIRDVADALRCAHEQSILHRDMKPANILIDQKGHVTVLDFGIALLLGEPQSDSLTSPGMPLGSVPYMSPEQVRGESHLMDGRTDVYGLGVTLFEALTGRWPFEGTPGTIMGQILGVPAPTPSSLRPGLGPPLDAICLRALAKKPSDRYPTMDEMENDIEAAIRNFSPPSTSTAAHVEKPSPRLAPTGFWTKLVQMWRGG